MRLTSSGKSCKGQAWTTTGGTKNVDSSVKDNLLSVQCSS